MQLHFTKMHGCGNDYIYLDCRETGLPAEIAAWSQKLSRRHFSIGADGIICICPPLTAAGKTWDAACISTGNPHCIIEWPDCDTLPTGHALAAIGPEFEHHPAFPEGVNTEFVYIESPTSVVMRVWERGSGETFACGTGSCATVAALVLRGVCPRNVPVDVHLLGGILSITITADDDILMTGPAETAFVGCVEV